MIKILNRHVTRVADVKEDALESLYEKRLRKKQSNKEIEEDAIEVDPVDALPVKTLDGKLYYRTGIFLIFNIGEKLFSLVLYMQK